jgi:WD40 repeat protein
LAAAAMLDNRVRLWDVESGRPVRTLIYVNSLVYGMAFAPDGRTLTTTNSDNTLRFWGVRGK